MTSLTDMPADIVEAAKAAYIKQLEDRDDSAPFYTAGEFKEVQVGHIARAILAERQRDQWQDIATAPKDGTHILAVLCREATVDIDDRRWPEFREVREIWFKPYRSFGIDLPWHAGDPFDSHDNMPTDHMGEGVPILWMPLQSPPKGGA